MKTIKIENSKIGYLIFSNCFNDGMNSCYSSTRFYYSLRKILPDSFMLNKSSIMNINENDKLFDPLLKALLKEKQDCENDNASFGVRKYPNWYYNL